MRAKLKAIKTQLRFKMHEPIPVQGRWLGQVVRGYFASETCSYLFHRVEYAPFGERECLEMLTRTTRARLQGRRGLPLTGTSPV